MNVPVGAFGLHATAYGQQVQGRRLRLWVDSARIGRPSDLGGAVRYAWYCGPRACTQRQTTAPLIGLRQFTPSKSTTYPSVVSRNVSFFAGFNPDTVFAAGR